ncbi:MAG: hypothetical protein NZ872_03890 [Archaeoglobaceae archaeon]|nr:hypothetical protein [Archaeoglobaceae archaeon]MDW8128341.1 hypothetical protein [Archaeoglobaceae archaeon]
MINMAGEKPTAAYILSLIGGILGLLLAIGIFVAANLFGPLGALFGGMLALVPLIFSLIIIWGAMMIKSGEPKKVKNGGIIVVVFSILSGLNIIALIGGILALVWKPPAKSEAKPAEAKTQ